MYIEQMGSQSTKCIQSERLQLIIFIFQISQLQYNSLSICFTKIPHFWKSQLWGTDIFFIKIYYIYLSFTVLCLHMCVCMFFVYMYVCTHLRLWADSLGISIFCGIDWFNLSHTKAVWLCDQELVTATPWWCLLESGRLQV